MGNMPGIDGPVLFIGAGVGIVGGFIGGGGVFTGGAL